jgi:hypothetical protein
MVRRPATGHPIGRRLRQRHLHFSDGFVPNPACSQSVGASCSGQCLWRSFGEEDDVVRLVETAGRPGSTSKVAYCWGEGNSRLYDLPEGSRFNESCLLGGRKCRREHSLGCRLRPIIGSRARGRQDCGCTTARGSGLGQALPDQRLQSHASSGKGRASKSDPLPQRLLSRLDVRGGCISMLQVDASQVEPR